MGRSWTYMPVLCHSACSSCVLYLSFLFHHFLGYQGGEEMPVCWSVTFNQKPQHTLKIYLSVCCYWCTYTIPSALPHVGFTVVFPVPHPVGLVLAVQSESGCANVVSAAPCQAEPQQYEVQFGRLRNFLTGKYSALGPFFLFRKHHANSPEPTVFSVWCRYCQVKGSLTSSLHSNLGCVGMPERAKSWGYSLQRRGSRFFCHCSIHGLRCSGWPGVVEVKAEAATGRNGLKCSVFEMYMVVTTDNVVLPQNEFVPIFQKHKAVVPLNQQDRKMRSWDWCHDH